MKNKTRISLLAILIFAGVSACDSGTGESDSSDPAAYQYKGAADPLLNTPGADRAGGLSDRFDLVQGRQ